MNQNSRKQCDQCVQRENMDNFRSSTRNQYLAAIAVNLVTISFGSFCGWPSASFLTLQSPESPLETGPMSNSEVGWVASMLSVGGLCGNIFFAWLSDVIGRKRSLQLIAIPALIAWLIIPFARCPTHFCISRFFGGFSGGGTFSLASVYITEIADDRIRGKLGSLVVLFCNFGVLLAFILGSRFRYDTVALMLAPFSILFFISFSFMPDTPVYLSRRNQVEEALKSLSFFRKIPHNSITIPEELLSELEKLKGYNDDQDELEANHFNGKTLSWKDFNNRVARKAISLGIALVVLNEFCGCSAMISYSGTIFKKSGSSFSPTNSTIIVGVIHLVGCYMSTLLVDRAGRRFLLTASAIGTGLGQLTLGTFMRLTSMGYDLLAFNWIPVASFSFTIFAASCGLLTLQFLVISEIMPPRIRSKGCMMCVTFMWIFAFFILRFLPVATEILGMDDVMFAFGGFCFLGALFVALMVPETRGKSFEEIMKLL